MLGQPVYFLTPDVVGFEFTGALREGVTATDLVLTVTEILRKQKVVGKFVEFFGEGIASLAVPDRATIANMAPEYGATMGFFPVDDKTIDYFEGTGRTKAEIEAFEAYFKAQGMFGMPRAGEIDYSQVVSARPRHGHAEPGRPEAAAGPHRARQRQEAVHLALLQAADRERLQPAGRAAADAPPGARRGRAQRRRRRREDPAPRPRRRPGAPRSVDEMAANKPTLAAALHEAEPALPAHDDMTVGNGDVLIAAITSCTNTSNPSVLLAAGLLAKKAVEAGLTVKPHIKTSLAPGSRIVTEYLDQGRPAALPREARLQRRRLRLHHLHRQRRRPDARAERGDHQERPDLRRGAVGQPQLRGAHPSEPQGQLPRQRRRWWWPTRSPARC